MRTKIILLIIIPSFLVGSILAQSNILMEVNRKNEIFSPEKIKKVIEKSCEWQINSLPETSWIGSINEWVPIVSNGWIRSAFLTGVMAAYKTNGNEEFLDFARQWGNSSDWEPAESIRHADDQCCIQTYAELYEIDKNPKMIEPAVNLFNLILENPMRGPEVGWKKDLNWSWCDALFMAPPALARIANVTGEEKYLSLMDTMFLDTYNFLYDEEYNLFFRDSSFKRDAEPLLLSENGKPIFWSRGNGWVLAGLARVLQYLPEDYSNRDFYLNLFLKMSSSIAKLQRENGMWSSNLLDPESYPEPESSGTGFFCYALTGGLNQGILEKDVFLPVIEKAWTALINCLDENGKLHWVQLVGSKPGQVKYEDSVEYGVGAFLLAATEVYNLSLTLE